MKVDLAISLLLSTLQEAANLGAAINGARAAGRDDLTDEEVAAFAGRDDDAKARLQAKIDAIGA